MRSPRSTTPDPTRPARAAADRGARGCEARSRPYAPDVPNTERRVGSVARRAAAAAVPSRSAVRVLRQFLNARREGWVLERRLEAAARMVATEARACDLPPERMIVALKRTWRTLDEAIRLPMPEADALLSRLVALAIRAYYEPTRGGTPRARLPEEGTHAHSAA